MKFLMNFFKKLKNVNKILIIILIIDFILDVYPLYVDGSLQLKYLIYKISNTFFLWTAFAYLNND